MFELLKRTTLAIGLAAGFALGGCGEQPTNGNGWDDAGREIERGAEDTGREIERGAEDAGREIERGVEDIRE